MDQLDLLRKGIPVEIQDGQVNAFSKAFSDAARAAALEARRAKSKGESGGGSKDKPESGGSGKASTKDIKDFRDQVLDIPEKDFEMGDISMETMAENFIKERGLKMSPEELVAQHDAKSNESGAGKGSMEKLTSLSVDGGFDDGTAFKVNEVDDVEEPIEGFEERDGDAYVKLDIYDEGKSEGGHSTYAINNGKVRLVGTSSSGPWGIAPGPDTGQKEISLADFKKQVVEESKTWKAYWDKERARGG